MSARDDLLDWLESHPDFLEHHATMEEVADDILNRHAHELAEEIRDYHFSPDGEGPCCEDARGAFDAVDLIDPEAG
ncbi:hypothetical protein [Streptomyces sp. URMC 129]|uniref:hypothetical protein n=1 Tax=Streptomyces sp. URMC 129 TaxID=3423407 RepID=UPI003F19A2E9